MQWKPNTTVAAIAEQDNRFLLVEEININGKLVFNQPAGHLEQGETLIDAIKREVLEETAWEFDPKSLIGIYLYPNSNDTNITYLRFCFYGHCLNEHKEQTLDNGILRATWLTIEQIRAERNRMRSPMVIRCINDYLKGYRYPLRLLTHYPFDTQSNEQ